MLAHRKLLALATTLTKALDQLEGDVREARAAFIQHRDDPTKFNMRALATYIHDFYQDIEDIFTQISEDVDEIVPESSHWHKQLLNRMACDLPTVRPSVISDAAHTYLEDYLRFRHFFRNLYGQRLEWDRLLPLFENLLTTFDLFRNDLATLIAFLKDEALRQEMQGLS